MSSACPGSLAQLAALLDQAATAFEVFGADVEGRYRRYAKLCHPDRYPAGAEQEMAARVFRRLTQWLEIAKQATVPQVIASPSREYTLIGQLAAGDLADIHLAVAEENRYLLKITRPVGGNPLLASEAKHLRSLAARCGDRRYREYLPRLVESFVVPGAGGGRQANVFVHRESHPLGDLLVAEAAVRMALVRQQQDPRPPRLGRADRMRTAEGLQGRSPLGVQNNPYLLRQIRHPCLLLQPIALASPLPRQYTAA